MLHIHVIFITWCSAPSLFGCDQDYPIIAASTVDRCSRSILQHIERFNIGRLKKVQVSSGYPVNDNQRALVSMDGRSEEHTSELQSRGHLVCRLLLEKKQKHKYSV